jgi:hypothetical protein
MLIDGATGSCITGSSLVPSKKKKKKMMEVEIVTKRQEVLNDESM